MNSTPSPAESPVISVEQVSKVYPLYASHRDRLKEALHPLRKRYHQDFYALRDVSFEVYRGETVGIIGRNGSGKSTLLSVIAGILQPTQGKVEVKGRISSLLELGAGFNPELSGMDNIYFYGLIAGFSRNEMQAKLQAILDFAEIGEFVHQPMKVYSSGMFVRLAFACAIHIDPEILIVDEALAVGDMNFQAKCMTAITRIQQSGATVLFVSHDIGSVKSLCSRAVFLEHGSVKFIGKASEAASLYVQRMREELNEEANKFVRVSSSFTGKSEIKKAPGKQYSPQNYKTSLDFEEKVKPFRYGNGKAKVHFVELLDEDGEPVLSVDFGQKVKLKIYFEATENILLSPNFYIQDDKKNVIFGGGPRIYGAGLLETTLDGRYVYEYEFDVVLSEGNFSIQIQLTSPVIMDESAEFIDIVENAVVFNVRRRTAGRLWSKVFIPASLTAYKIQN